MEGEILVRDVRLKYIYNNESICAIAIYSVLKRCHSLTYSQAALIPPMIFNNKLIAVLNGKSNIRGIEELMIKKGEVLTNFNNQYVSLLPLMFNTLVLLEELEFISIDDNSIKLTDKNLETKGLGKRTDKIMKCASKIANLLQEDTVKLYLQLRVVL